LTERKLYKKHYARQIIKTQDVTRWIRGVPIFNNHTKFCTRYYFQHLP